MALVQVTIVPLGIILQGDLGRDFCYFKKHEVPFGNNANRVSKEIKINNLLEVILIFGV